MKIILGSGSPRRKELMESLGLEFEIIKSDCEEIISKDIPWEIVMELAEQKALDVAAKVKAMGMEYDLIIGADTVVAKDHKILGKPVDREDAKKMLELLSGDTHHVYTGVSLVYSDGEVHTFYEATEVEFFEMEEDEIQFYLNTDEPYDKAGSYAVQGIAGRFVKKLNGDYNNVVGLPIARLYHECKLIRKLSK